MIFDYSSKKLLLIAVAIILAGCSSSHETQNSSPIQSVNICTTNHGQIVTQYNAGNYAYQVCLFDDNRQCSVNALQNKQCPIGGIKIIGYDNSAQIYCAINGGKVLAVESAICTLNDGTQLSAVKYYQQPILAIESIGISK